MCLYNSSVSLNFSLLGHLYSPLALNRVKCHHSSYVCVVYLVKQKHLSCVLNIEWLVWITHIPVYEYLHDVSHPLAFAWSITSRIFSNCVAAGIWLMTFSDIWQNIEQSDFSSSSYTWHSTSENKRKWIEDCTIITLKHFIVKS